MMPPGAALTGLKHQRPEWEPWLAVVEEILREIETSDWDAAVPSRGLRAEAPGAKPANWHQPTIPLLAGATLSVQTSAVRAMLKRLIRTASRSGAPKMATLESALHTDLDLLALFKASLCQDSDRLKQVADVNGADGDALQAVIALVPLPLLHACARRWRSSISESWVEGYCPVCGSWPAFAEERGIERSRCFRCGRCGGEWHARCLSCPYCTLSDHEALVSLVPETGRSRGVIEACTRCLGYVKTFTRLQGCPPASVLLDDLASADLDVAAFALGYAHPPGPGYALDVTVVDNGAMRRLFAWNA
jgi:FdhE protein